MENYCNFCAEKHETVLSTKESTFICNDQKVIIDDLLKIFRNDIIELFSFIPTCSVCSECLKQLINCYIFVQNITEAATRFKVDSEIKNKVNNEIVFNKEQGGAKEISSDTTLSACGTETNDQESVCGLVAVGGSSNSLNLCKAKPILKPLLPKTSDMHESAMKIVDTRCTTSSTTSRLYKCLECAESFKSFKHLRDHESESCFSKNVTGVFICKYCHLCFVKDESMVNHQSLQHSEQQFLCCLCKDKVFTSKGYLTRHINKIHDHPCLQYFCGECKEVLHLSSQEDVKEHFNNLHISEDANDDKIENEKSQEPLNEEDMDLEMHEEFLDEFLLAHTNENSFQFSEWEALDLHLPDMLQAHSTSFHNSEELSEAFPCPKCFEQFRNPQPLLKHLAEQHNLPVFICRTCRKSFTSVKEFRMHKVNKCESTPSPNILSIPCPYCIKKTFTSSLSLKQHLRIVHTQHKKHICQLCDKQYSTLDHLKKHVLSQHQNERKHICHVCTKSFTQLCHLKQHLAIHTTGKTIQCRDCPERFWRNIDMQRHRQKLHAGK